MLIFSKYWKSSSCQNEANQDVFYSSHLSPEGWEMDESVLAHPEVRSQPAWWILRGKWGLIHWRPQGTASEMYTDLLSCGSVAQFFPQVVCVALELFVVIKNHVSSWRFPGILMTQNLIRTDGVFSKPFSTTVNFWTRHSHFLLLTNGLSDTTYLLGFWDSIHNVTKHKSYFLVFQRTSLIYLPFIQRTDRFLRFYFDLLWINKEFFVARKWKQSPMSLQTCLIMEHAEPHLTILLLLFLN